MICLKIRTFVVSATTPKCTLRYSYMLWFAWKFVPLWYQQQPFDLMRDGYPCCDLLENSYLCGISNNFSFGDKKPSDVVICLKIRTFVVSATTNALNISECWRLWFAWKFVPLWYQQQHDAIRNSCRRCCDLLENSYLCGISNNSLFLIIILVLVVICLKIRTFVVSATTFHEFLQFER